MQFGATWYSLEQTGGVWCILVHFSTTWYRLVQLGAFWCRLGQFGGTCCSLVQLGTNLVDFDADWCTLE